MQYGRGMKATPLTLYRDRSILRKSPRQAIKIFRETKTFFLAIVISLFRAARARSLFYHIQGRRERHLQGSQRRTKEVDGKWQRDQMTGDNKRQADSMYQVYKGRQYPRLIPRDAYPVGRGIFSCARTFLESFNADR